jgi:hypothetical protein
MATEPKEKGSIAMETDYLIIGSGAVGMAFADTLLDESDAHITLVDRRAAPGGHWNDAYSFVGLHQPSAYYGVNSTELGSRRKDEHGPNAGMYELAGGPEINAYYDRVMRQKFLPSGRVSYHPSSEYAGDGRIVNLISGSSTEVSVRRKTVDASFGSPNIPATHKPGFEVAEGVRLIPPNALTRLWLQLAGTPGARQFCVLGAGKTAMDVIVWLLRNGASPASIQWVVPRDSWLQNRLHTQPGLEYFDASIGGEADKMEAFATASSSEDLFLRLEALGQMLRIDPNHAPTMFHYATISTGEVELLRTVSRVVRLGRVKALNATNMVLERGEVEVAAGTVFVDCTASAVGFRRNVPVFQDGRIVIQLLRAPLMVLSAALTAYIEVHGESDAHKNQLATPVPFPKDLQGYARATAAGMMNQFQWSQMQPLRQWLRASRLDGFAGMVAGIDKADQHRQSILMRLHENMKRAMGNMAKLSAPG